MAIGAVLGTVASTVIPWIVKLVRWIAKKRRQSKIAAALKKGIQHPLAKSIGKMVATSIHHRLPPNLARKMEKYRGIMGLLFENRNNPENIKRICQDDQSCKTIASALVTMKPELQKMVQQKYGSLKSKYATPKTNGQQTHRRRVTSTIGRQAAAVGRMRGSLGMPTGRSSGARRTMPSQQWQ